MEYVLGVTEKQLSMRTGIRTGGQELGEDAVEADELSEATKDVARSLRRTSRRYPTHVHCRLWSKFSDGHMNRTMKHSKLCETLLAVSNGARSRTRGKVGILCSECIC